MTRTATRRVTARRPSPAGFRGAARIGAAAVAIALFAGCSESDPGLPTFTGGTDSPAASETTGASAAPTASATAGSGTDAVTVTLAAGSTKGSDTVLPALSGYANDLAKAMADPSNAPRSRWATSSGQSVIEERAASLRKEKQRTLGPIALSAKVRLSGSRASVSGCLDQSKVQNRDAKGRAVPPDGPEHLKVQVTLTGGGDTWLVQSFSVPGDRC